MNTKVFSLLLLISVSAASCHMLEDFENVNFNFKEAEAMNIDMANEFISKLFDKELALNVVGAYFVCGTDKEKSVLKITKPAGLSVDTDVAAKHVVLKDTKSEICPKKLYEKCYNHLKDTKVREYIKFSKDGVDRITFKFETSVPELKGIGSIKEKGKYLAFHIAVGQEINGKKHYILTGLFIDTSKISSETKAQFIADARQIVPKFIN